MSPSLLPLLLLVAGCYCAPKNWLDIGGTLGYESHINGTIGGNLKADRDGLSVNGTGSALLGASWIPKLTARGHVKAGDYIAAGDASMQTVINNSWRPGFSGEIGRNSNGTWMLGFNPTSELNNTLMFTPRVRVKTGDDARALVGMPLENNIPASKDNPIPTPGAPYTPPNPYPYQYGNNPYGNNPYGNNPYGNNPYGNNPYGNNPYGNNPYGNNPYGYNPYAGYGNNNPYASSYPYGQQQVPQTQTNG